MLVQSILTEKGSNIISAKAETSIADVAGILKDQRIGAVLVLEDDGTIDGVLSERDIVRGLATQGAAVLSAEAKTLMTRDVITCGVNVDLRDAMALMTKHRIRHLPIVEDNKLIGLISIGDLVKYLSLIHI